MMDELATSLTDQGFQVKPSVVSSAREHRVSLSYDPKPYLYLVILLGWIAALLWFEPRLLALTDMAYSIPSFVALFLFVLFINLAWLYGFYNVGIIIFSLGHKLFYPKPEVQLTKKSLAEYPSVAILYTTCNDFVESSVKSCVDQDYPSFTVYILDDSTEWAFQQRIDDFAAKYPGLVQVVRRANRKAFKAGNLNHGLSRFSTEKYFAIADADEVLPVDFLRRLVPVLEEDPRCGFVQANHKVNPHKQTALSRSLGVGIDIHWKYYQPLRNDFGFVMFLGHGALLRRKCWEEIGGFPDIVSEDLGFAIHARELGYRGRFVSNVTCYEDFPDTVRSFRIRHMKWTRGTTEFLAKKFRWLINAKNITWTEKLDILFPTLNLPLTLVYFFFMVLANLGLPYFFGERQNLTLEWAGLSTVLPVYALHSGFQAIFTLDFFLITVMTFFAPVLCFAIGLIQRPLRMLQFISHSTAIYASLGPLSSIGVLAYVISGKAIFLVTGDKFTRGKNEGDVPKGNFWLSLKHKWRALIQSSHPDNNLVQFFELMSGLIFSIACVYMFQISFMGLCLAFIFMPVLHRIGWEKKYIRLLAHLPYLLIMLGISLAGLSVIGMQTMFFGYGFHF